METSQNGIKLICQFEGLRLKAYKPVATEFYFTIGYGHSGADVKKNMTITKEVAENLLKQDLKKFENYVNATKLKLNQNQYDALISFTYNCGSGCLQTLVKNRTLKQIGDTLTQYNKAGGKVLAGLTKRRKAEQELFFKAVETKQAAAKTTTTKTTTAKATKETKLPYEVKTKIALNVRSAAGTNYPVLRVTKKGEKLKIWAEITSGGTKWGKNGQEFYCLEHCQEI